MTEEGRMVMLLWISPLLYCAGHIWQFPEAHLFLIQQEEQAAPAQQACVNPAHHS